jgi:hypothetical protein
MKIFFLLWAMVFQVMVIPVTAQSPPTPPPVSDGGILPGPTDGTNGQTYLTGKLIPKVGSGFVMVLLVIGVAMLIIAGIMYIFSSGESEMVEKGKTIIIWTLSGIGIAILSLSIVKFVTNLNLFG